MAKLHFSNTTDDLVAFGEYHYGRSRAMKAAMLRYQWWGTAALFTVTLVLLGLLTLVLPIPPPFALVVALLYASLFAWNAPRRYRATTRKHMVRMYAEGANKRYLAPKELEVLPDGLMERTPYSQTKLAWGAIEKIESDGDFIYLYIGATAAHIIPTKRVDPFDLREFMSTLQANYLPDALLQSPLPVPVNVMTVRTSEPPMVAVPEVATVAGGQRRWYQDQ